MSVWKRFLIRIGRCPYCGLHYLPPSGLLAHLTWGHASQRREWMRHI